MRIDEDFAAHGFCRQSLLLQLAFQDLTHLPAPDLQELRCAVRKRSFRDTAMPRKRNLQQCIVDTGSNTGRIILFHARAGCDGIGCCKANAIDLTRELIRMMLQHIEGKRAVLFKDACSIRAGNTACLKPDHDLPKLGLCLVRRIDLLRRFLADAFDLFEPARMELNDLKRLLAELRYEALGGCRSDAINRTRSQEPLDAREACRS